MTNTLNATELNKLNDIRNGNMSGMFSVAKKFQQMNVAYWSTTKIAWVVTEKGMSLLRENGMIENRIG